MYYGNNGMETTLNRYICTCICNMVIMVLSICRYVHVHVLSSEIEKYQKQARALVQDLETKTREIEEIREHLQRTQQSR